MKKIISFEQVAESGLLGLDGAIACAFPNANTIEKEGMTGFPFGTVEIDGKGWDWLLKNNRYEFIEAQ